MATKPKSNGQMEEILAAAARSFFEKGYHATTIEDIAKGVGMLKGSLYYYIRSKEDLLYQLLSESMEKALVFVRKKVEAGSGPEDKLRRGIAAHIEYIVSNQFEVGVFLHEYHRLSPRRQVSIQKQRRKYQSLFVQIVREGQQKGVVVPGDPELLCDCFLGACNWIYRWYTPGHSPSVEVVKNTFVSCILHGILKVEGNVNEFIGPS